MSVRKLSDEGRRALMDFAALATRCSREQKMTDDDVSRLVDLGTRLMNEEVPVHFDLDGGRGLGRIHLSNLKAPGINVKLDEFWGEAEGEPEDAPRPEPSRNGTH